MILQQIVFSGLRKTIDSGNPDDREQTCPMFNASTIRGKGRFKSFTIINNMPAFKKTGYKPV